MRLKFIQKVNILFFFVIVSELNGYYDSSLGRWLNVDPDAEKYTFWNAYQYALNSPLEYVDPDGRGPWWSIFRATLATYGVANRVYNRQRLGRALGIAAYLGNRVSLRQALSNALASERARNMFTAVNGGLAVGLSLEIFPGIKFSNQAYEVYPSFSPDGTYVHVIPPAQPSSPISVFPGTAVEPFFGGISVPEELEYPPILLSTLRPIRADFYDLEFQGIFRMYARNDGVIFVPTRRIDEPTLALHGDSEVAHLIESFESLNLHKNSPHENLDFVLLPRGKDFPLALYMYYVQTIYEYRESKYIIETINEETGLLPEQERNIIRRFLNRNK